MSRMSCLMPEAHKFTRVHQAPDMAGQFQLAGHALDIFMSFGDAADTIDTAPPWLGTLVASVEEGDLPGRQKRAQTRAFWRVEKYAWVKDRPKRSCAPNRVRLRATASATRLGAAHPPSLRPSCSCCARQSAW